MNIARKSKIDQAQKYVLCFDSILYLSNSQGLTGVNLTSDIKQAQIFAHGFDNPSDKLEVWNIALRRKFNSKLVSFEINDI